MKIAKFKKNVAKAVAFTCAAATLVSVSPNVYADGCVPNSYPDDIHFNLHFDSFGNNSTIYEEVTRFATWDSYKGIIGRPYVHLRSGAVYESDLEYDNESGLSGYTVRCEVRQNPNEHFRSGRRAGI